MDTSLWKPEPFFRFIKIIDSDWSLINLTENEQIVEAPPIYTVKPELVNECERMMRVDFSPLALKKTIDGWIDEVELDVKE